MSSPPPRTEPATVSTSLSSTPTPTPALSSSVSNPTPTLTSTSTSTIPGNSTSTLTLTPTLSFARPASTSLGGRQHSNSNSNSNGNQTNNQHGLTIVLKIGSGSLSTSDSRFLNLTVICTLVETICRLQRQGHRVVLVSSGAVSIGCQRLGLTERPSNLITKQAVAAVGQSRLMRVYDDFFTHLAQPIAQVLLSRENLSKKHHYTNALNTFRELLRMGIVPIVNENDTVAVEELRFGDNDTLSALVASLVQADWLLLLTDVDALYTCDPRSNPSARPIHVVSSLDELRVELGGTSSWGTGGMTTKIQAARISTAAGVRTGIINSNKLENIEKLIAGHTDVGTQFTPAARPIRGKKKWIAHGVRPEGEIQLDSGAVRAILKKKSLFAAGITGCTGSFESHSCVILRDPSGIEIGRGIVNYSSSEVLALKGSSSTEYQQKLGYAGSDEIIHRENLAITASIQTQTTHHIDAQTAQQNLQLHDTEQDGDSDDTTLAQQQHEAAIAAANRLDPLETVMDALPLPSSTSSSSSISSRPRSTSPLPSPPPS